MQKEAAARPGTYGAARGVTALSKGCLRLHEDAISLQGVHIHQWIRKSSRLRPFASASPTHFGCRPRPVQVC